MAFGTLRFGEQGAASLDQQEEARRHAGAQVPGRALQQSRGGFAVSSADGRRGEFGQDGGGDVVVDQVSVLGEGGAELRVRAVVVALGHRRQPQGTAGQDRDGAALQGVDEGQRPLGAAACLGRFTEQRQHGRVEGACARLGVIQAGP